MYWYTMLLWLTLVDQSELVAEPYVLVREATRVLAQLNVPADQIRGAGLQVSRLDSDPDAAKSVGKVASRVAAAGQRSVWVTKARRCGLTVFV